MSKPWPGYRWYFDHPLMRRWALSRLVFKHGFWRPDRKHLAPARALYWWLVRGHETEICQRCGSPVEVVFWTPDAIWTAITGESPYPDGEAAPGILCVSCVDDLVLEAGLPFLQWTCSSYDKALVTVREGTGE